MKGQSNSRDSAIDNDFQDWDTEVYECDLVCLGLCVALYA